MTWRALTNHVLSSLFEPPCAACASVLPRPLDGAVCDACWAAIAAHITPVAGARPSGIPAVDAYAAIGEYDGRLRDVIHALKYDGRRSIAPRLAGLMRTAGAGILRDADVSVPVPLHRRRQRSRGFNQADDLASALGLPVRLLLRRVRFTTPQIELPAGERHHNVRDAFGLQPSAVSHIPAVVVLVDDVSTTGATLNACARVLKAAGVKDVRALTAARVATGRR